MNKLLKEFYINNKTPIRIFLKIWVIFAVSIVMSFVYDGIIYIIGADSPSFKGFITFFAMFITFIFIVFITFKQELDL